MKSSANHNNKHTEQYPSARKIRRACDNELYRTMKRLGIWIPSDKIQEAEKLYYRKVILNSIWIYENRSNRRLLADWWDENVNDEIAALWNVEPGKLRTAFRDAFGG
ncbi:dehydrogenase [Paenibacillus spongiae]|uniref:Dehydrogenase n=1 Tax=Paenibacillus spongiae TaxID=2909671 RepID=A0ABY5SCH2_9BACL|nr:dehydrogenase [Paenibacillus spongiae]UVI31657.1 dehydrogenase [Paenibacillus spongiae]